MRLRDEKGQRDEQTVRKWRRTTEAGEEGGCAEIEERKKIEKSRSFPSFDVLAEFNRVLQDELYSFFYFSFFLYRSIYPSIPLVFLLSRFPSSFALLLLLNISFYDCTALSQIHLSLVDSRKLIW